MSASGPGPGGVEGGVGGGESRELYCILMPTALQMNSLPYIWVPGWGWQENGQAGR